MRNYILAAVLAGAVATPALAQSGAPFTGVRAEGIVGYERAGSETRRDKSDGVTYGAGVGFDFQAAGLLAGVEGEVSESTVGECTANVRVAGDRLCAELGRDFYVGGRFGGLVGPNTLAYAKGGYTNARIETAYTAGTANELRLSTDLDGYRVGGGIEHAVGPNSFIKAEYRYSNYEQRFEKHQGVVGFGFRF